MLNEKFYIFYLFQQTVTTEINPIDSNQEETDTRVILYLSYIERMGFSSAIVRTPDTDVFFLLLCHAHDFTIIIYLDIGTGKHRKLVNITELANDLGEEWCSTLLGFHVFFLDRIAPVHSKEREK